MPQRPVLNDDVLTPCLGTHPEFQALRGQGRWKQKVQIQQEAAKKVEISVAYLSQNLNKPLQVCVLAALAGVSASWFFKLFKHATGCSPICFFTHLRMRRACELLQDTTLNVKDIADSLGYKDNLYFSRVFKSVTGVSPCAYRTRAAEGQPAEHWMRRIPRTNSPFRGAFPAWPPADAGTETICLPLERVPGPKPLFSISTDLEDRFDQKVKTVSANQYRLKP
jgi:AraC-like DNA-binding protein